MYTIAIDAMGGDYAPQVTVEGSLEAIREYKDMKIILVGQREKIEPLLKQAGELAERIDIVDAREVILNTEAPVIAVRRKTDSSLVKACQLLRDKQADALVSAGSTGAVMIGGMLRLGRIPGVDRPALATVLPTLTGSPTLLLDTGANTDCRPQWLEQFACMGTAYAKGVMKMENPRVSLLNIGEEEEKGNMLTKETAALLRANPAINYAGNIESRQLMSGETDVIVCDGFHGNLAVKGAEGMATTIFTLLKRQVKESFMAKLGIGLAKKALYSVKKTLSAEEVGGAPLLGVEYAVVKAHGNSTGHAFFCGIRLARRMLEGDVVARTREELTKLPIGENKGE